MDRRRRTIGDPVAVIVEVGSHANRGAKLLVRRDGEIDGGSRASRQSPGASQGHQRTRAAGTSGPGSSGHKKTSCHAGPTCHSRDPTTTISTRMMRTPLMMCCLERGFMDYTLCRPHG
ncbi:hypothetical protein EZV78_07735 [Cutibacterium avidum]|nr:hypothetical protein EZV78_07735 [Cutibacterium avidum]